MVILIVTILFNALLTVIFRYFKEYKIRIFPAIVINYGICSALGILTTGEWFIKPSLWHQEYFPYAVLIGFLFITGFVVVGVTVRYFGVTLTTIMQKISVLATVLYAILLFDEGTGWRKMAGIALAILAIVLVNWPEGRFKKKGIRDLHWTEWVAFLPFGTFLVNGAIDITFFDMQVHGHADGSDLVLTGTIFTIALIIGLLIMISGLFNIKRPRKEEWIAGFSLGIPNFASIFLLLQSLGLGWEGSVLFPVLNIGILLTAAALAFILFRERMTPINYLGVIFAVIALYLISYVQ